MATSFSGGGRRSTRREPPTMSKQLINCITCGCESSAPFLKYTKPGANPRRIGDILVRVVRSSDLTHIVLLAFQDLPMNVHNACNKINHYFCLVSVVFITITLVFSYILNKTAGHFSYFDKNEFDVWLSWFFFHL